MRGQANSTQSRRCIDETQTGEDFASIVFFFKMPVSSTNQNCNKTQNSISKTPPMKKLTFLFLFIAIPYWVLAQADHTISHQEVEPCPNPKKLRGLCAMIGSRMQDQKKEDHLYRTRIMEAACIDSSDTEEEKNKKIRDLWMAMEDELVCDSSQFDVVRGNVLKYAVSTKNEDFIRDAIKWKINLNRVDSSDNRTVLDYISYHIQKHKGNSIENMFNYYYKLLRDAGAKHKSEF
jgi:hypothetical protein